MKKHFPTYVHDSCRNFEKIYVSAGKRGLQLYVTSLDLITEIKATVGYIIV
jgi:Cys-tRNA(Pro)/Cys-tRNA(Cys) deacylase